MNGEAGVSSPGCTCECVVDGVDGCKPGHCDMEDKLLPTLLTDPKEQQGCYSLVPTRKNLMIVTQKLHFWLLLLQGLYRSGDLLGYRRGNAEGNEREVEEPHEKKIYQRRKTDELLLAPPDVMHRHYFSELHQNKQQDFSEDEQDNPVHQI
ncbi:hypothetical protein Pcinc_020457 [Petrolisthes cinctipes]|uniref:Uncharacterized protein n=1 Tax=Petrolisthes cinctipes TaxID=88211 RepID=A0AAE1FML7_PETCI|nr:hypothetical protein Pcinc_020457 [Petrolisthes cinctipes]